MMPFHPIPLRAKADAPLRTALKISFLNKKLQSLFIDFIAFLLYPYSKQVIWRYKMNIAFFLTPKSEVAFLYDDQTLRQGLEKMRHHSYAAIPVITRDSKYVGTISDGDFLRYILRDDGRRLSEATMRELEDITIAQVLLPKAAKNPAVRITQPAEDLLLQATGQNFIPVIDDYGSFIGIVTRKDILSYFYREMVRQGQLTPTL